MLPLNVARRVVAEGVGTAMLLATVVGSGIMADRLSGGNVALTLLANALATGAGLVGLILTFGPISGAHFNPVVSFADASQGGITWSAARAYAGAQVVGAIAGVMLAHAMFAEPLIAFSHQVRAGFPQLLSECVATFGLLATIWGCVRSRPNVVPFAVGAYITAAYWFTVSTSFANPAVTIARSLTDTFSGIRPVDVPGFIVAQAIGAGAATTLFRWLMPPLEAAAGRVVVEHAQNDRSPYEDRAVQ
jgi:glycerol uptake facilitator-like aquaporin